MRNIYTQIVLTVIAVALVASVANRWGAQAQGSGNEMITSTSGGYFAHMRGGKVRSCVMNSTKVHCGEWR